VVDSACGYCDQSGIGAAEPTQLSWVSAVASPGAPRAAAYSEVGVRLRKSPTPPRRKVVCGPPPPEPPPNAHVNPTPGETCSSLGIRAARTPNSESTA